MRRFVRSCLSPRSSRLHTSTLVQTTTHGGHPPPPRSTTFPTHNPPPPRCIGVTRECIGITREAERLRRGASANRTPQSLAQPWHLAWHNRCIASIHLQPKSTRKILLDTHDLVKGKCSRPGNDLHHRPVRPLAAMFARVDHEALVAALTPTLSTHVLPVGAHDEVATVLSYH